MTLSRVGESLPYVSYAIRTSGSAAPESSSSGSGKSTYRRVRDADRTWGANDHVLYGHARNHRR